MMGYDTLLSSYYDHYVLDYEMFEPWNFNYTTLQIPTGKTPMEIASILTHVMTLSIYDYGKDKNICVAELEHLTSYATGSIQ